MLRSWSGPDAHRHASEYVIGQILTRLPRTLGLAGIIILALLVTGPVQAANTQGQLDKDFIARVVELYQTGKFNDGIKVLEVALEKMRGEDDTARGKVASALLLLSVMQMALDKNIEAEKNATEALAINTKLHGPDGLETAAAHSIVADASRQKGDYKKAEQHYKQALAVRQEKLPDDDADLAWTLNGYALNLQAQIRYKEAATHFERALAIRLKKFGPDAPIVADTLDAIGNNAVELADLESAKKHLNHALRIREKNLTPADPRIANSLSNLSRVHQAQADFKTAVKLNKRALEIREKAFGKDSVWAGISHSALAISYSSIGDYNAADIHYKTALEIYERFYGPEHIVTAVALNNLAELRARQQRFTQAEEFFERAAVIREKKLGKSHRDYGRTLAGLANVYVNQARFAKAQKFYDHALRILEAVHGPKHPEVARTLSGLARALLNQSRYRLAEQTNRRALRIREANLGPQHPDVATTLEALALGLHEQGRLEDAEPLLRRALAINTKFYTEQHAIVATNLNNLARLLEARDRLSDAVPLFERAIAAFTASLGEINGSVAAAMNNLGAIYRRLERNAEAEQLFEKSARIASRARGHDHPETVVPLNNLASLYTTQKKYSEAEPLLQRTLNVARSSYGPDHPSTALAHANLATVYFRQGDWRLARDHLRQSTRIYISQSNKAAETVGQGLAGRGRSLVERQSVSFQSLVKANYRIDASKENKVALRQDLAQHSPSLATSDEAFIAAQWASSSSAARSLAQMSAREAGGNKKLTALIRERQDLVRTWAAQDRALIAMRALPPSARNPKAISSLESVLDEIDKRVAKIDLAIARDFPAYADYANPQPLTVAQVQSELRDDEALVYMLTTDQIEPSPGETFVWVITKSDARWTRSKISRSSFAEKKRILRCALDTSAWSSPDGLSFCAKNLNDTLKFGSLPFNNRAAEVAHELFIELLAPSHDLIKGRALIVIPTGPLASIPFHLLLTRPAERIGEKGINLRTAPWLIREHAVTVLPSVASLNALRHKATVERASRAFIGYGDPILAGGPHCGSADPPKQCPGENGESDLAKPHEPESGLGRILAGLPLAPQSRGGSIDQDQLRTHCPLPDTAFELRCVAESLKPSKTQIVLRNDATETHIKKLSERGELADYRIVHFATHGILPGELSDKIETESTRQQKNAVAPAPAPTSAHEAGLILTPPDKATDGDDGLLTTTEIANLKLNADWVILSACNTAAGDQGENEALSGLARAFFYAGTRALLVSHWYVYSPAAVKLTSRALSALRSNPEIGRAEAMRRSMLKLIETGSSFEIHPAYWAPFVVVGDGGG